MARCMMSLLFLFLGTNIVYATTYTIFNNHVIDPDTNLAFSVGSALDSSWHDSGWSIATYDQIHSLFYRLEYSQASDVYSAFGSSSLKLQVGYALTADRLVQCIADGGGCGNIAWIQGYGNTLWMTTTLDAMVCDYDWTCNYMYIKPVPVVSSGWLFLSGLAFFTRVLRKTCA